MNIPPNGGRGQQGHMVNLNQQKPGHPFHGYQPQPVYQPGQGGERLMASGSHAMENTVEYGPEITGPQAQGTYSGQQPPHSPPQGNGVAQPAPQFNTQGTIIIIPVSSFQPVSILSLSLRRSLALFPSFVL